MEVNVPAPVEMETKMEVASGGAPRGRGGEPAAGRRRSRIPPINNGRPHLSGARSQCEREACLTNPALGKR